MYNYFKVILHQLKPTSHDALRRRLQNETKNMQNGPELTELWLKYTKYIKAQSILVCFACSWSHFEATDALGLGLDV